MLYTENDWVYVVSEENKEVREGFIPHSYCAALGSQQATLILNMKKKMPRDGSSLLLGPGPGKQEPDLTASTSAPNIAAGKGIGWRLTSVSCSSDDTSLSLHLS